MKRYVLFVGEHYYPKGGALDLHSSYSTLGEAQDAVKKLRVSAPYEAGAASLSALTATGDAWWHVMDGQTGKIVCKYREPTQYRATKKRHPTKAAVARDAQEQRDAMIGRLRKLEVIDKTISRLKTTSSRIK